MSKNDDPYSRHYWKLVDDPKFADVYGDDHHYATWSRLLMIADQAWPASAHLPATARKASVAKLVEVNLIVLPGGGRFRVTGLDKERAKRSQQAQHAADARWGNAGSNAPSNANSNAGASDGGMPSKAKQSKDEQSTDEHPARATDPADIYWSLTGRYPTEKTLSWVDDLASSYGPEPVIRALATAHGQDHNASSLLGRTQDILRAEARALSLKEQTTVRQSLKERRAAPREDIDQEALHAEIRRLMQPGAAA